MFRKDLETAWHNLMKNKVFSLNVAVINAIDIGAYHTIEKNISALLLWCTGLPFSSLVLPVIGYKTLLAHDFETADFLAGG